MTATRLAVVTIVHGRRPHLVAQHRSLASGSRLPDHYVVVAMDEPDLLGWAPEPLPRPEVVLLEPGPGPDRLPLAAARNAGVARARELGAGHVVLLDVDCLAGGELVAAYAANLDRGPGTVWCGPVTYLPPAGPAGYPVGDPAALADLDSPHPARPAPDPGATQVGTDADWELFWSLSFAVHGDDWDRVGGFCEDYTGYGGEDTDFAQLARRAGLSLAWTGGPRAYHQHHGTPGPPVQHAADIVANAQVFHRRWGWWPMSGWLAQLAELGLVRQGTAGWELAP